MNLRNLKAAEVNPMQPVNEPYAPYAGAVAAGLQSIAQVAQESQVAEAKAAKAAAETADAAVLGAATADALDISFNSLADNVVADMAKRATEEGATLGATGGEVLQGAYTLSQMQKYLRDTGQMNTLQQMKLIRKQQELIAARPDLGVDIVRVTNAAAADANALLKKDEDDREAAAAATRAAEQDAYKAILVEADDYDPKESLTVQREKAMQYQWTFRVKNRAADALLALEQDHKAAGFVDAKTERERQRSTQLVLNGQYIPTTLLGISATARQINRMGLPSAEAEAQWQEARIVEITRATELIKDPTEQQRVIGLINDAFDKSTSFATGKAAVDEIQREVLVNDARAKLTLQNVDDGRGALMMTWFREAGPSAQLAFGSSAVQDAMSTTMSALWQSAAQRGVQLDDAEVRASGLPNPRSPTRASIPDPSATSPFMNPEQRPSTVTDGQVRNGRETLFIAIEATGESQNMPPHRKAVATQAVISGFTDPVVVDDPVNTKAMMYGLANLRTKGAAFAGNPDAEAAQAVYRQQVGKYIDSTLEYVSQELGVPDVKSLVRVRRMADGNLMYEKAVAGGFPTEKTRKLDAAIAQMNQNLRAAVVGWAHLNGSDLTYETTSAFVQ